MTQGQVEPLMIIKGVDRRIKITELASEYGTCISNERVFKILACQKCMPDVYLDILNMQDRQQRVESRASGSVQCQTRRLSNSSVNRI